MADTNLDNNIPTNEQVAGLFDIDAQSDSSDVGSRVPTWEQLKALKDNMGGENSFEPVTINWTTGGVASLQLIGDNGDIEIFSGNFSEPRQSFIGAYVVFTYSSGTWNVECTPHNSISLVNSYKLNDGKNLDIYKIVADVDSFGTYYIG